jgi:hypothetical protein
MIAPWCQINPGSTFVGDDGDKFTLEHDARFEVAINYKWGHFRSIGDLGDPFC